MISLIAVVIGVIEHLGYQFKYYRLCKEACEAADQIFIRKEAREAADQIFNQSTNN